MTVDRVGLVEFTPRQGPAEDAPLVVLGPALGTSVGHLYAQLAPLLADRCRVLGWDLPGHGTSDPAQEFDVAGLADAVVHALDEHTGPGPRHMVGTSIGGAVVQELLSRGGADVASATLVATSPFFPDPGAWRERAELVAAAGTPTQVVTCARAWFAPDLLSGRPEHCTPLLHDLQGTDRFSYAAACRALGGFDLRQRTGPAPVPTAVIAGTEDAMTGPDVARDLAEALAARCEIVDGAAHLIPVAAPDRVAATVLGLVAEVHS